MVRKFEAANPNIKVEINTAQDYSNVLRTQLQGGSGADVFYVTGGGGNLHAVLPLAQQNQLKELTADWAKKAVPASAKEHFTREGKQYALPVDLVPITQTVNLTAYKELGLSPAKTLDELYSQCAAATARGKSLFAVAGAVPQNLALHAIQIAANTVYASDPTWNEKRAKKEVTFAGTAGWRQALDIVLQLKQRGCYQRGAEGGDFNALTANLTQGRSLGIFAPAASATDLKKANPNIDFGVTVFPAANAADTKLTIAPTNALAINAKTKYPDQALKLLEFFAQPENQKAFAETSGNISLDASKTVPPALAGIKDFLTDESKQRAQANAGWPSGAVYNTALGQGVQGLLTGQTTPERVLQAMDQAFDRG
jgi:raffinose/stachyose/melibiose transport system substrate-binding protein